MSFLRKGRREKKLNVTHDPYFKKFLFLIAGKQILKQKKRRSGKKIFDQNTYTEIKFLNYIKRTDGFELSCAFS